jgi:hypothetical protein
MHSRRRFGSVLPEFAAPVWAAQVVGLDLRSSWVSKLICLSDLLMLPVFAQLLGCDDDWIRRAPANNPRKYDDQTATGELRLAWPLLCAPAQI